MNKKITLLSAIALISAVGTFTCFHNNLAAIHADSNDAATNHGDYDGWLNSDNEKAFTVVDANTNKVLKSNFTNNEIDKLNQTIFSNARTVYSKYGFKDGMTKDEAKQAYQKLYQAYFGDKNGFTNRVKDLSQIYSGLAPKGEQIVTVKMNHNNGSVSLGVVPTSQADAYFKAHAQDYQAASLILKKVITSADEYQKLNDNQIPTQFFDHNESLNDNTNSASSSSQSSSQSSSSVSSASSTSEETNDNTKPSGPVESELTPAPISNNKNKSNDTKISNASSGNTSAPADNDTNDSDDPTADDSQPDTQQTPGSQGQASQQPASNGQSDGQVAASPDNQTLPQTNAKASIGLLALSVIPMAGGLKMLLPNEKK